MQWDPLVTNAMWLSETISLVFSTVLSQQQEHIAIRLHYPWFSVERIDSYELILFNGHESNRCLQQKFLRQKINSSQITVCRFQWLVFESLSYKHIYSRVIVLLEDSRDLSNQQLGSREPKSISSELNSEDVDLINRTLIYYEVRGVAESKSRQENFKDF